MKYKEQMPDTKSQAVKHVARSCGFRILRRMRLLTCL